MKKMPKKIFKKAFLKLFCVFLRVFAISSLFLFLKFLFISFDYQKKKILKESHEHAFYICMAASFLIRVNAVLPVRFFF